MTMLPPGKEPTLRVVPMPADANQSGDIFGGWIMSQVDIAGSIPRRASPAAASRRWRSIPSMFKQPVLVGDLVSFYAEVVRVGRTSITVNVEVYAQRRPEREEVRQSHRGDAHLRRGRRAAAPACCISATIGFDSCQNRSGSGGAG